MLALLLGALVRRAWTHYQRVREVMPLIGILGFMTIGNFRPRPRRPFGMFVGLALIGCDFSRFWIMRTVTPVRN